MSLKGKDFLSIHDLSVDEIYQIFDFAKILKARQKAGEPHPLLKGKTLGMIFQKASTRTRVSFEVGMYQLGGTALFLSSHDLQIGRGEPVKDTARVLSRYLDGIMIRTFSHLEVEELADYASIPVINALTDLLHPCQAMADIFTTLEHKGSLKGLKLCYIGDGNNMVNSLLHICAKVGMDISVATPPNYAPDATIVEQAAVAAKLSGSKITIVDDPFAAAKDADVLYTDVWASMGKEGEQAIRKQAFAGFQINSAIMQVARKDSLVMHCLPAHRGEEITDDVMEGPNSVVFDEAENRLHIQKAIMALLMAD
ncbi:ornithine carbamoyltransferase [Sporomusa acidovorans]|uniref:Ornithine carbamoyltransferase n=1 Tax=Sporomusa acidovorans (strain ATCC 49682 / DSM 3132 / Mol) TaxID=1123286 RepID=A0ABZ3IX68_SPOA4|nr:ornithine carbamoyltransferase [Sporomusa acidovorans]OZC13958.1 ornithine carbamoyltransferase [Sporomusa acidovorans DSM 3132]SDF39737.1 ornithine carbamoyltransferase [Sporomusa acidovorans]